MVVPTYDGAAGSYAERLRGRRFWLPLLALFAFTVAGAVALNHKGSSAPPLPPTANALAGVDAQTHALLTRLEADQLFCGALRTTGTETSCLFGATASRTTVTSYANHRAVVAGLKRLERAARDTYARTRAVTYAVTGPRWLITGLWSQTGHYNEGSTVYALTAQAISKRLNGCLELLPREAGSCAF